MQPSSSSWSPYICSSEETSLHERNGFTASKRSLASPPESTTIELAPLSSLAVEMAETPQQKPSWVARTTGMLSRRFPWMYGHVNKVVLFVRGPESTTDLSDLKPLLDIDRTIRGKRYHMPLESSMIRFTRPLTKEWIFIILAAGYIIGLAFLSKAQSFDTPATSFVDCTSTYWLANDGCGLNGQLCGPFTDNSTFDFRCPAQCSSVILQNPRTVGNEEISFVPLIVGGGDAQTTYRGDSFICAASVQAGIISNSKGGCGNIELIGNFTNFLPFTAHGLSSIGFDSIFPVGFRISPSTALTHCEDIRNPVLAFNVIITSLLFFVFRPKPIIVFWSLVCIGYWHVSLFSQPRAAPPPLDDAFGTFLPALFVCYAFWRLAFRFTLPLFLRKAPYEGAIWYIGPFWVGVLANITFDEIPISTLTAASIKQRAGGITSLVIIVVIVAAIALNQVLMIRKTGWLPYYLKWYILGGLVLLVIALLPGLELRLHHYIIAMVLMPGTAFPTRLSAIYQGFLLGLFLNGVAAFDFDSILQTAADLREDAPIGTELPQFLTNSSNFNSSISFINQTISWLNFTGNWDGFELLVDDVERYVGTAVEFSLAAFDATLPHFFRLAFTSDGTAGDFTKAATLWPNGTWVDPSPGPS